MNSLLPVNINYDIREPVQPIHTQETTDDYKQLVGRLNEMKQIENIEMPMAFGESFFSEMEFEKMMRSMPMRLPGLKTASISKDVMMGTDDDITLDELFEDVDYCYPTFSVHELLEKNYF